MPAVLVPFAVATALQAAAGIVAAGAGAAALLLPPGRSRAFAFAAAIVTAALALATLVSNLDTNLVLAAAAAGAIGTGVLAVVIYRHPHWLPLLAVGALPFRLPVTVGDETANLLLPLYLVIGAGCLAHIVRWMGGEEEDELRAKGVSRALALVVVLYSVQTVYSTDVEHAVKNVAFFYVPFALLFRLLADLEWSPRLLRAAFQLTVAYALAFAVVGFVEYATGHLVIPNPKVEAANELQAYFRVNSLFFDPNIYGRFLALTMVALAGVLLWTKAPRAVWAIAGALIVLWAGLVLSLSQTSFAALLVGLGVLAALRWRPVPAIAAAGLAVAASVAVIVLAPGSVGIEEQSEKSINRATSGRLRLTEGAIEMARDRPVWGFGSGSFGERYRKRERIFSPLVAAESHTIPLTAAAEQGVIGLAAYLALLWTSLALVFGRVRQRLRESADTTAIARVVAAAAFCALLVHTMAYAAFLEDATAWLLLGLAVALRTRAPTLR